MKKQSKRLMAGLLLVCMMISLMATPAMAASTSSPKNVLSSREPSAWAKEIIQKAQEYSDSFILDWNNRYTDDITRGQFGILIDSVLYSKIKEYPEYSNLEETACKEATKYTVAQFNKLMTTTKTKLDENIGNSADEYEFLLNNQLNFRSKAIKELSKLYPEETWIGEYSRVLSDSIRSHFNDTQVTIRPYCEILYNAGIASGTSDTTFAPNRNIKRQEAAVMMYNLTKFLGLESGKRAEKFADDADISNFAKEAVYAVSTMKSEELDIAIIAGIGDNKFGPLSNMTIEQAIVIIYRLSTIL